jgi:hypothetical protein
VPQLLTLLVLLAQLPRKLVVTLGLTAQVLPHLLLAQRAAALLQQVLAALAVKHLHQLELQNILAVTVAHLVLGSTIVVVVAAVLLARMALAQMAVVKPRQATVVAVAVARTVVQPELRHPVLLVALVAITV